MELIELRDLTVAYRASAQPALDGLSLSIRRGERVAITGANGSGKSTLLAVIGGMLKPKAGVYRYQGRAVSELSARELADFRAREIGFVFQNICLLPHLTLVQNVAVPIEHEPGGARKHLHLAARLLDLVGIGQLGARFPHQVSGGQAQRAAIARALIRDPGLILADEPTGSLDPDSAMAVLRLLNSLAAHGKTVLVVTHSAEVANELERTVLINRGRLAEPARA
jgi:putative ABC transport system ATP-binding protein